MDRMSEAVELLSGSGVIDRLKFEVQAPREAEREKLLVELAQVELAEETRGAEVARVRAILSQRIARLEAELQAAQRELQALIAPTGFTIQRLRGRLRKLSDPRIERAIYQLNDMDGKACSAFRSNEVRTKLFNGARETRTVSNANAINEALALIRAAVCDLKRMQESRCPDNLDVVLESKLEPIKLAVQRLHGFN